VVLLPEQKRSMKPCVILSPSKDGIVVIRCFDKLSLTLICSAFIYFEVPLGFRCCVHSSLVSQVDFRDVDDSFAVPAVL